MVHVQTRQPGASWTTPRPSRQSTCPRSFSLPRRKYLEPGRHRPVASLSLWYPCHRKARSPAKQAPVRMAKAHPCSLDTAVSLNGAFHRGQKSKKGPVLSCLGSWEQRKSRASSCFGSFHFRCLFFFCSSIYIHMQKQMQMQACMCKHLQDVRAYATPPCSTQLYRCRSSRNSISYYD